MNLNTLHQLTQRVIDAIGEKKTIEAKVYITQAEELLINLTDSCKTNMGLIELSKYETLIKVLKNKLK